jgi:hypothetical protein
LAVEAQVTQSANQFPLFATDFVQGQSHRFGRPTEIRPVLMLVYIHVSVFLRRYSVNIVAYFAAKIQIKSRKQKKKRRFCDNDSFFLQRHHQTHSLICAFCRKQFFLNFAYYRKQIQTFYFTLSATLL